MIIAGLMLLNMLGGCTDSKNIPTDSQSEYSSESKDTQCSETDKNNEKESFDMISYWSFDSIGSDNAVVDSSNRKNGTAHGCEVSDDAIKGSSLLFQPSQGGCVSFGTKITDALKQTGAVTVSFWYYSMTPLLQKADIFCLWMEDGAPGICLELSSTSAVVKCRSHEKEAVRTRTFALKGWGEWIHLTLSVDYNNGKIRLFKNGTEITANEQELLKFGKSSYSPGTPMYEDTIGGFFGDHLNVKGFSGKIDEVYLFSKAATDEEISALYSIGRNVTTLSQSDSLMYSKLRILTSMGAVIISEGNNIVLYNADRCYLVPGDADIKVFSENGNYYAPLEFYRYYCGKTFTADELNSLSPIERNGYKYISVQEYARIASVEVKITDTGRIVLGRQIKSVDDAMIGFIDRYYSGGLDILPTPETDVYSTRKEVLFSDVVSKSISLGSPSVLKLSDGVLLCSYDYNGKGYKPVNGGSNDAGISMSEDNGATWTQIAIIPRMLWGSLFCIDNTVYLMGRDTATGKLAIVKSTDSGYTWTATSEGQIDSSVGSAHRAPTPAVIHNGRVYLACEDSCDAYGVAQNVPTKRAYMMSAPVASNLLLASSWTKSDYMPFDPAWVGDDGYYGGSNTGFGFYEGNAVCGKDGTMYIILRMDSDPSYGKACMLKLSDDNRTLSFERIIELPVGKDKFAVRYDDVSGKYIAVGNKKTTELFPTQRNVIAMYYSDDLINWSYAATLISDNTLTMLEESVAYYGYQYPDFIINGTDILMVVREASGNTTYFHNANYISYYTVKNFRDLLTLN